MTWAIRSCVLAVGAAALLSAQTVYAAPAPSQPSVDPLVSLSVLGTAQSRAAVCGAAMPGATCAVPTAMTAAAATAVGMAQDPPPPPPGKQLGALPLIIGFLLLVGLAVAILAGDDDASGDLQPISPA